jgi:hypothetical protein
MASNYGAQPGLWSPNTNNLLIGKGICLLDPTATGNSFFHMGNVPSLKITPKSEPLDHYSAMIRLLVRDLRVVVKQDIEMKLELEEFSVKNLGMVFSGNVDYTTPLYPIVDIMSAVQITGWFKFFATNDVGPRWYMSIPSVMFLASGTFDPISEKFANCELTGSVNFAFSTGTWGTIQLQPAVGTIAPENVLLPFIVGPSTTLTTSPVVVSVAAAPTLTVNIGGWIGANSYSYQWEWADTSANIAGATSYTYLPVVGDETHTLACKVTGTNLIGSTVGTTVATAVVTA